MLIYYITSFFHANFFLHACIIHLSNIYYTYIDDRGGEIGEIIFYSISATFKYHIVVYITITNLIVVTSRLALR